MAIDSIVAESQSPSPSNSSNNRHFYLAVDRIQFKMETLVDLLGVIGRRPGLPIVVCCSSRDELDAVCYGVSGLGFISSAAVYSDLSETDRAEVLQNFYGASLKWHQNIFTQAGDAEDETGGAEKKSHMIIVTDACLPIFSSGEPQLSARVLINYELPAKKEIYTRRTATCLAPDGIVINMVVGGEVMSLRSLEESMNLVIAEMPINVSETL
ncbi:Eukaryotic initiation factor 4A-like protein [Drosera capensis]